MAKSIAKGTYKVLAAAILAASFPTTGIVDAEVGKILEPGRTSTSGKTATAHWAGVTLTTEGGEKLLVDGLRLVKQALTDEALRNEVFGSKGLKASIAGADEVIIEVCNFKAEFNLGLANGKFMV